MQLQITCQAKAGAADMAPMAPTASGPLVDRALRVRALRGPPGYSSCVGGRTEIKRIVASEDGGKSMVGQTVSICGWVRTAREAGPTSGCRELDRLTRASCTSSS